MHSVLSHAPLARFLADVVTAVIADKYLWSNLIILRKDIAYYRVHSKFASDKLHQIKV